MSGNPGEWDAESGEAVEPGRELHERSDRLKKSPSAFRTISEVADDLHIPQHVLRFWETRFPQVKPLKRGGGRRYYRPDDIALLRRISELLYIQGYTIKGVQRLLREGDGSLDDVPPPGEVDRDGDEADAASGTPEGSLPAADEDESLATAAAEPETAATIGLDADAAGFGPAAAAAEPVAVQEPVAVNDGEAERLRSLLLDVLGELQDIRRQIEN
ncbi:MAG: MerR family transcriptional regulator [Gluconacetobacter diazotrophicus]|nr:MerR family transcriptional regulator [Gluconacetobacter diazotrophicus]